MSRDRNFTFIYTLIPGIELEVKAHVRLPPVANSRPGDPDNDGEVEILDIRCGTKELDVNDLYELYYVGNLPIYEALQDAAAEEAAFIENDYEREPND